MPNRKRKSLLKRPTMKKSSEPYVKLEKLDEDQIKKLVKKENEDYFDSLLNDFGEEEDDLDDSPQLDAKTGEFKTKEKEDNDIEILEEVVNVQRPKKELQLVKLVKIAPKPEVSVKKVKLDPSTGLFQDESGQEIQIVEKQKICKEVVKIQPLGQVERNNNGKESKDSNENNLVKKYLNLSPKIKVRKTQVGEKLKHGKVARLQHELPSMPILKIQRRRPIPVNKIITNLVQKIGNQTRKIFKFDNQHLVQMEGFKQDVSNVNNQHCLVMAQGGWVLTYLTVEDWKVLVKSGVPIIRSSNFDE